MVPISDTKASRAPASASEAQRPIVAAFDFDGTITTKDTFLPFLYSAFGRRRVLAAVIELTGDALGVVLGVSNRDRFKEFLVAKLLTGESVRRLRQVGEDHAQRIESWVRPAALERIQWHRAQGHRLVMVSASLDLYLESIVQRLGFDDLVCTRASFDGEFFDGQLIEGNCRRAEKVRRLVALIGSLERVELFAYGDSVGDKEMLDAAEHAFFRPFENRRSP